MDQQNEPENADDPESELDLEIRDPKELFLSGMKLVTVERFALIQKELKKYGIVPRPRSVSKLRHYSELLD